MTYPPCLCDDLRGDGLCLACASTPADRKETNMLSLSDWLLEQIAEDERVAREAAVAADGQRWGHPTDRYTVQVHVLDAPTVRPATEEDDAWFPPLVYDEGACPDEAGEHIAAWDPARVLAECAAKRRVVETWTERWREAEATERHNAMFASQATGLGVAVRVLAELYADRPGFREEWRG